MKKLFCQFSVLFLLLMTMTGCDDNVNSALCKTWLLVSYRNESNEVLKEAEGYYYIMTIHSDWTYTGKIYGNEMFGQYSWKNNEIRFTRPSMTLVYYVGSDPDKFFRDHLVDVYSYTVTHTELRLYYSEDEYFKFRVYNE